MNSPVHMYNAVVMIVCMCVALQSAVPLKQQRKQFREAMCRMVVSEVKPFYMHQPEKFNSYVSPVFIPCPCDKQPYNYSKEVLYMMWHAFVMF